MFGGSWCWVKRRACRNKAKAESALTERQKLMITSYWWTHCMCNMRGEWGDDKDDISIPFADIRTDVRQQGVRQSEKYGSCVLSYIITRASGFKNTLNSVCDVRKRMNTSLVLEWTRRARCFVSCLLQRPCFFVCSENKWDILTSVMSA